MTTNVATLSQSTENTKKSGLSIALWVVQGLLFALFAAAGAWKSFTPLDQLALKAPWVSTVPGWLVRFIGISELAAGLGMLLPSLTRVKPWLTPLAAAGLVVVMLMAMGTHIGHGELNVLPINVVLGGLAAFVAWGRFKWAPIADRIDGD